MTQKRILQIVIEMDGERQVLVAAEQAPDKTPITTKQRRLLFAMADECGLSRPERLSFTEQFLDREVTTWAYLTAYDAARLIDAFNGYTYLTHIIEDRTKHG